MPDQPRRILLVEDHPANILLFSTLLKGAGYLINTASSLCEARHTLQKDAVPDLILMDIGLPDGNGLDLVRELRAGTLHARTPVIAVTAYAMSSEQAAARAAGCDEVITKPVERTRLLEGVAAIFHQSDRHTGTKDGMITNVLGYGGGHLPGQRLESRSAARPEP